MEVLYSIDAGLVALALLMAMLATVEAAFRYGRRRDPKEYERSSTVFSTLMGAALALLGLLLAFSFAMASARYDLRKSIILKEANAIGTAWLRTDLAAAEDQGKLKQLLRDYVDVRLQAYQNGLSSAKAAGTDARSNALQQQLWAIASAGLQREKTVNHSLLVQSFNDMIDVSSEQGDALANHVPESVLWLLMVSALLSAALSGYACGAIGHRNLLATTVFAVLVTLVIFVILDLDRPQRGLITLSKHPMQSLQASMRGTSSAAAVK
jgi:hypothetical protein